MAVQLSPGRPNGSALVGLQTANECISCASDVENNNHLDVLKKIFNFLLGPGGPGGGSGLPGS